MTDFIFSLNWYFANCCVRSKAKRQKNLATSRGWYPYRPLEPWETRKLTIAHRNNEEGGEGRPALVQGQPGLLGWHRVTPWCQGSWTRGTWRACAGWAWWRGQWGRKFDRYRDRDFFQRPNFLPMILRPRKLAKVSKQGSLETKMPNSAWWTCLRGRACAATLSCGLFEHAHFGQTWTLRPWLS